MTNFEKYRDVILKITNISGAIAVVNDEPEICLDTDCSNCQIMGDSKKSCSSKLFNWLCQEYKEKPTLSRRAYYFLKSLPEDDDAKIKISDRHLLIYVNCKKFTSEYVDNIFIPVLPEEYLEDWHEVSEVLTLDVSDD